MKKVLFTLLSAVILISCGPSAEQKAAIENDVIQRLKAKDDSIATAIKNENAIKDAQKHHDDSIVNSVSKGYRDKESAQRMNNQYNSLQKLLLEYDGRAFA